MRRRLALESRRQIATEIPMLLVELVSPSSLAPVKYTLAEWPV
jgi:hypothetical protein